MNIQNFCQSCAMPMTEESHFGTNTNGTKNVDYCCYCYQNGSFTKEETMEEMIENCIPFTLEAGVYPDENAARAAMLEYFPNLKRWKKI
ncbi:zinc ribbon domain-containing protein [Lutispora thermophila]|uniref:Zinc ribbon domain-containing protein n=2 Tax=Lutispora saccharofermentans TaxID=3024236 RepID=A0ABT1NH03_9FIRM|nr:zinc ribbon domain-containing protein [Lutispora saccharofermentans]MCQ1530441.1 zinc ribbon domain-containing protein [Lutispora saccharofermentans]